MDLEKLAQAAGPGSVGAVGGSITSLSVKLSKLSIEFIRGIMGRFSLDGTGSVSQMTRKAREL